MPRFPAPFPSEPKVLRKGELDMGLPMGPTVNRIDQENRLKALVAFAADLEHDLHSHHVPPTTTASLYKQCDKVSLLKGAVAAKSAHDLDARGTRLWNRASKLKKGDAPSAELTCLVRVFASLLLDCAQQSSQGPVINDIRVFKSALRTAKYCLEQQQLNLTERVIEPAAGYEEKLTGLGKRATGEQREQIRRLSYEYHLLRITLAWRQDRLDLAELMLIKIEPKPEDRTPSTAESLADLFYEIGKDQASKSRAAEAIKWLTKAYNTISGEEFDDLSSDAPELQLSIVHRMVRALMDLKGEDNITKAWNLVQELNIRYGSKLVVLLLKLDLYALDSAFPPQDFCDVLQKIVRTVHLTKANVKTVLHYAHKLRARNVRMAHIVLVTLATERLLGAEEPELLEKTLITVIWNCTTSIDFEDAFDLVSDFLNQLHAETGTAMSSSATHAAQIFLCRRVDASYNQELYENARSWCTLSLHSIFACSGTLNVGKLQRKLMLCALGMSDPQRAREVYFEMSETNKKHPSTQYLIYKVALRSRDSDLAAQSLDSICASSTKDATLLYACVLEAQRAGDRTQSVAAMQRVLDKYDYGAPSGVHLPALLRCTARMLIQEIESAQPNSGQGIEELCKLFEGAAAQAKPSRCDSKDELFSVAELNWFSRNSYNLALKVCTDWEPHQTLRLVTACLKFLDIYPLNMDANVAADLSLRRLFCDFLSASLQVVSAREEDNIEIQLQHYLKVRKVAGDFRSRLQEQLDRLEGGAKDDLLRKHSSLLAFDFEAAACLKAWDSLEALIAACEATSDPKIYAIIADIMLSCEAPTEVTIAALQQVVNATHRLANNSIPNLSRWIRCLFSLALTSAVELAEHLLSQVVTIATSAKNTPTPYPAEELEYLATTTFNRAVDFYCSSQDAACRRWAEKALEIADVCSDGGALRELLMEKYGGLSWEG